jgi:hypothetical protein
MKNIKIPVILLSLSALFFSCQHPSRTGLSNLFAKDKVDVKVIYFFDKKFEAEIQNLDAQVTVSVSKALTHPIKQDRYAMQYDYNEAKNTRESLDKYLASLESYNRYIIDFRTDSLVFKIFTTARMDVTKIILVDHYNEKYRFVNEYYFVYGTILKVKETEKKSLRDNDFDDAVDEKITEDLFDENKMFYKSVTSEGRQSAVTVKEDDARDIVQHSFLLRQFCHDVVLKIKDTYPDWFRMDPEKE